MANFKISQLEQLKNIDSSASLLIVQNGKNYRVTVGQLLDGYLPSDPGSADLSNYYTKDEVNNIISVLNADVIELQTSIENIDLSQYYTKDDVYNKTEVYTKDEVYSKDIVYTKTEADAQIIEMGTTIEQNVNAAIKQTIEQSIVDITSDLAVNEEEANNHFDDIFNF